jgi:hypothetical protein
MSEAEMQELQNRVVESIQDYFDSYDWMPSSFNTLVHEGVVEALRVICQSLSVLFYP